MQNVGALQLTPQVDLRYIARSANLEPRIRELSRQLLDRTISGGEMDLVADYAVPLPMQVIAGMIGIPTADWPRSRW